MSKPKSIEELKERLSGADSETLLFLYEYQQYQNQITSTSTIISTLLATIAGAAIVADKIFPDLEILYVVTGSIVLAITLFAITLRQRKKRNYEAMSAILSKVSKKEIRNDLKDKIISEIVKGDGK